MGKGRFKVNLKPIWREDLLYLFLERVARRPKDVCGLSAFAWAFLLFSLFSFECAKGEPKARPEKATLGSCYTSRGYPAQRSCLQAIRLCTLWGFLGSLEKLRLLRQSLKRLSRLSCAHTAKGSTALHDCKSRKFNRARCTMGIMGLITVSLVSATEGGRPSQQPGPFRRAWANGMA